MAEHYQSSSRSRSRQSLKTFLSARQWNHGAVLICLTALHSRNALTYLLTYLLLFGSSSNDSKFPRTLVLSGHFAVSSFKCPTTTTYVILLIVSLSIRPSAQSRQLALYSQLVRPWYRSVFK